MKNRASIQERQGVGVKYFATETDFKQYVKSDIAVSNCVSILFINKGSNTVNINGLDLAEGESLTISQNEGNLDQTQYQFVFAADGLTSLLQVIRILPKFQAIRAV